MKRYWHKYGNLKDFTFIAALSQMQNGQNQTEIDFLKSSQAHIIDVTECEKEDLTGRDSFADSAATKSSESLAQENNLVTFMPKMS